MSAADMSAADLLTTLAWRAAHTPRRAALEHRSTTVTWEELYARVTRARARHRTAGDRTPGRRVGLLGSNHPDTVVALLAVTANGTEAVLHDARATAHERARTAALATVTTWHAPSPDDEPPPTGPPAAAPGPERPARYFGLVTSGTGDEPKVVRKHWGVTLANAAAFADAAGYGPDDRVLCTTPLHHAYAFGVALLPALLTGATLVLAPHPAGPATLAAALRDSGATVVQSVPFLYRALLDAGRLTPAPALRVCVSAGEPLTAELARDWRGKVGVPLRDQYGATEFGQIAFCADDPDDPGSPGEQAPAMRLMPGIEARLRTEDGRLLEHDPHASGELYLRQDGTEVTYWGLPGLGRAGHIDGWFRTGDTGRLPTPRTVVVEGRTTRRISVAGRKVDPDEVERAVRAAPGVIECKVAAPPEGTEGHGDRFVAFVAVGPGVTETGLRRHVARTLSSYKVPTRFHLRDALPRTGSGKVHLARLWQEVTA
ncbi:fatty acid--CoA ligase family protein [Streptomyces sp. NPDC095613]|uniref:class I adenylate-forming enzyme family protein n=1 Tax=Streptomyces sp. NPDC095613 TaxID=3155540 RepID=UPI003316E6A8